MQEYNLRIESNYNHWKEDTNIVIYKYYDGSIYSNMSIKPICDIADATAKTLKDRALITKIQTIKKHMIDAFSKERDTVVDMNYVSIYDGQAFFQDNDFYGVNFRIHFNYPAIQDLIEKIVAIRVVTVFHAKQTNSLPTSTLQLK